MDYLSFEQIDEIHKEIVKEMEKNGVNVEDMARENFVKFVENVVKTKHQNFDDAKSARATNQVVNRIVGLGPLEELLNDDSVTEIMVNGMHSVFVEKLGQLTRVDVKFSSEREILSIINRIVGRIGRRIDESSPFVDARLKDGSRVNAIIPPLSIIGPVLTIRKFMKDPFVIEKLLEYKTVNKKIADFLKACVIGKRNIVISGGTGSGKTSTLNALAACIPAEERIITIEDAAELKIEHPHLISLESRPANIEGRGEVPIRLLLKNALRMRPDRIIIGEIRSGEALDMLQAMNTGHQGSLTTVHANAPEEALLRIETMALMADFELPLNAIRQQIRSAINVIVQQERLPGGGRKIVAIYEVNKNAPADVIKLVPLFEYDKSFQDFVEKEKPSFLKEINFYGANYAG